jgi:acyl-CoA synthetase (AMP-forming)/AMP-acid ligase II
MIKNSNQPLIDVEPGATGEICVSGPSVIKSYIGNVAEKAFQQGWFRTGDLGQRDEDGYVYITGRIREVIIRGGENIAPREVEEVLLTHPAVREVAVVGRPNPIYGEVVVAYIVPQNPAEYEFDKSTLYQRLHQYASEQLSPAKVPVDFIIVNALPHTISGKIARHELQEQESQYG